MNIIKCTVCKTVLPELSAFSICEKSACIEALDFQMKLNERKEIYTTFWDGEKIPNEANYEIYLTMIGLENSYKKLSYMGEERPPKFSRRTWYNANIVQSHYGWPDEFGRERSELF